MTSILRNVLYDNFKLTYPISNTNARDFVVFHKKLSKVSIFVGGFGDINNVLYTILHRKKGQFLNFHLNDIDCDLLARGFLILCLCVANYNVDFIFSLWANQGLTLSEHTLLCVTLNDLVSYFRSKKELFKGKYKLKSIFKCPVVGHLNEVLRCWESWSNVSMSFSSLKTIREKSILFYSHYRIKDKPKSIEKIANMLVMNNFLTTQIFDDQKVFENYIITGIFKKSSEKIVYANPTFLTNSNKYFVHPSTFPHSAFADFGNNIFDYYAKLIKTLQKNVDYIQFSFYSSELTQCFDEKEPTQKFDLITTSNMSDIVQLMNIILSCKDGLKENENSYLEVETMKVSRFPDYEKKNIKVTDSEFFLISCLVVSPYLLHTLFGVLLSFSFSNLHNSCLPIPDFAFVHTNVRLYFQKKKYLKDPIKVDFLGKGDVLLKYLLLILRKILKNHSSFEIFVELSPALSCETFMRILLNLVSSENNIQISVNSFQLLLDIILLKKKSFVDREFFSLLEQYNSQLLTLLVYHFPHFFPTMKIQKYSFKYQKNLVASTVLIKIGENIYDTFMIDQKNKQVSIILEEGEYEKLRKKNLSAFLIDEMRSECGLQKGDVYIDVLPITLNEFVVENLKNYELGFGKFPENPQNYVFYEKVKNFIYEIEVNVGEVNPKFVRESNNSLIVEYNNDRFVLNIPLPFIYEKINFKKSRKLKKLFVIIPKNIDSLFDKNISDLISTISINYDEYPDYDNTDKEHNLKVSNFLSRIMFSMDEIYESRDECHELTKPTLRTKFSKKKYFGNKSYSIRKFIYTIMHRILSKVEKKVESHNGDQSIEIESNWLITFENKEETGGIFLHPRKIKSYRETKNFRSKQSGENIERLPILEVFYTFNRKSEFTNKFELMMHLQDMFSFYKNLGGDVIVFHKIESTIEEQDYFLEYLERNKNIYSFQKEIKIPSFVQRSVINPVFPDEVFGKLYRNKLLGKDSEKIFGQILTTCGGCGEENISKKFKRCSVCKVVRYCSRQCQRKHWKKHKKICKRKKKSCKKEESVWKPTERDTQNRSDVLASFMETLLDMDFQELIQSPKIRKIFEDAKEMPDPQNYLLEKLMNLKE